MNLSASGGQSVVAPNQSTFCGSFGASVSGISKTGEAGLQYSGSIAPLARVEPLSGASVIVHHLGHASNGLRGSMNIGQHESGSTSSSQKSRSVTAVSTCSDV